LQILGCELHKNAFVGRAWPEPTREAIALPQTYIAVIRGRVAIRGREGREGGEGRKGKGGLDLDICPGAPSS